MPQVRITPQAAGEFDAMDKSVQAVFSKHFAKLESVRPRRRMKVGENCLVEEAGQGRIVCLEEGGALVVIHVFATHKEYEKWYRGGR